MKVVIKYARKEDNRLDPECSLRSLCVKVTERCYWGMMEPSDGRASEGWSLGHWKYAHKGAKGPEPLLALLHVLTMRKVVVFHMFLHDLLPHHRF